MLTKRQLKALWNETGFRPLKRLGQNFLIDKNVKDKILRNLEIEPDDTVVEIGPGFGEMTYDLAERAKEVFAIEKDKKIVEILKKSLKLPGNLRLIESDFLDVDLEKIIGNEKAVLYGNIPYYVTSPIIEKLFDNISCLKSIYLLVQKEVANRIVAKPGSKDISRLSLYMQYYTEPKRLFTIGKGCFYPVPEVESAFLKLEVLQNRKVRVKDEKLFFEVIKTAYSQRRKTILNSLLGMGIEKEALLGLLGKAGIDPRSRAEEISLQDFAFLSDTFPK